MACFEAAYLLSQNQTLMIRYAWQGTWHFSKQTIFSSILGSIASNRIAYALGLAPSVGMGILVVLIVSAIAFF